MKRLTYNKILKGTRGESLIEGIVSLLILTLLIAAVTMTLNVAIRMTGVANREANDMQNKANEALMNRTYRTSDGTSGTLNLGSNVSIPIVIVNDGDFTTFGPVS